MVTTVKLKLMYDSKYHIDELDILVKSCTKLFDDSGSVSGTNAHDLELKENILLAELSEKTDFLHVLNEIKYAYRSLFGHTVLFPVLSGMVKEKQESTFNNFLSRINEWVSLKSKEPLETYAYYLPLRLKITLPKKEMTKIKKKIKNGFNLELCKLPNYLLKQIDNKKFCSFLQQRELLKSSHEGRTTVYTSNLVELDVDSFLGAILFNRHCGRTSHKFSVDEDYSLSQAITEKYFFIVVKKKIVYPRKEDWKRYDYELSPEDISLIGKDKWEISNMLKDDFEPLIQLFSAIEKKPIKIRNFLKSLLQIYFKAITDKEIATSFFKFWVIVEKIFKCGGGKSDELIVRYLKKLVKDKSLAPFIDQLRTKRNRLVHEYDVGIISQTDRNIIKNLAEALIQFLLFSGTKINNLNEFTVLLETSFREKEDLLLLKKFTSKILKTYRL